MNHLLTIEDLAITFANVFHVLAPGGVFVFDLNMAGAFKTEWRKSSTVAEADNLCYVRGRYDRKQRLGTTEITTFRLNGDWTRQDTTIYQRCYSTREIRIALARAGFAHVRAHAATSLGIRGRLAVGRTYFVAHR